MNYLLFSLLVMTGMGFGQTQKMVVTDVSSGPGQEFVITGCPKDGTVVRGKDSVWALAGSGVTVWPKQEYDEAKKRFMEYQNTVELPNGWRYDVPWIVDAQVRPEAEPIDVPAITKKSGRAPYTCKKWLICRAQTCPMQYEIDHPDGGKSTLSVSTIYDHAADMIPDCPAESTVPTCADPKRILLHDEDTPPTFWCHKVQP